MRVTKKEIARVLRTLDRTAIFNLYHRIYGRISRVTRSLIVDFIKTNAPSAKVANAAYNIVFCPDRNTEVCYKGVHGHFEPTPRQEVTQFLLEQCKNPTSAYAKKPILGHTHLYFASPAFGHKDYNRWRALPIAGNEAFCDAVIKYAQRFF